MKSLYKITYKNKKTFIRELTIEDVQRLKACFENMKFEKLVGGLRDVL